ncbi:hypothetical protein [Fluviicola sp.]|uniref:hypothetical protein n=1 Tax=Fluviicola sp. TaxID=1917219 RepID=UPI0031D04B3A
MNSIFLRAKHWQLFVPAIVVPFVTMITFSIIAFFAIIRLEKNNDRPEDFLWMFYLMPVIFILCGFVQFGWSWSVLSKLSKLIPPHVRFPVRRVKLLFIVPILYFCLLPFYIIFIIKTITYQDEANLLTVAVLGLFFFLLHFFSIFCMLHTFFFVAKTVKSIELQRNPRFSNFVGDFFLIWIFPVGIWFIQPRINALVEKATNFSAGQEELIDSI